MIKITDRFYITASTHCYTLQEKTTVKDEESKNYGQQIFKDLGYYSSIESCLRGFFKTVTREYISKDEENSIEDLIIEMKSKDKYLESLKLLEKDKKDI